MSLERVTNFLSIKPWLATAGMPTKDQLVLLPLYGYQNIINLALDDSPGAIVNEDQIVKNLGLQYFHVPVIWEKPIKSNFDKFVSIMLSLSNEKTFVHCVLNMRVSVFVYLYRVHFLQEAHEFAYPDVLKIWQPDPTWQSFIKEIQDSF